MLLKLVTGLVLSVLHVRAELPSKPSTTAASDGDWQVLTPVMNSLTHVGCGELSSCNQHLEQAKRTTVKTSSDLIPGMEPYLKDHEGISTRCSLTLNNVVEKFNGSHWVRHYECAAPDLCQNLMGSGSCAAGNNIYQVPAKTYLWSFFCPDLPNDDKTCQFLNTPPPDVRSLSEPPDSISHPPLHSLQSAENTPPTRCDPTYARWRQVWNSETGRWEAFDQCSIQCLDVDGEALCYIPATNLSQSEENEQDTDDQGSQKTDMPKEWIVTRCDPANNSVVQYLHPSQQWVSFYQCSKICKVLPEFAACEEHPGKFVAPNPPPPASRNRPVRREPPQIATGWTSRCDTPGKSGVTSYFDSIEVGKGNCPNDGVCLDSSVNVAVCKVGGHPYLMSQVDQRRRGDPYNPTAPDFHTFDTRCNPHNANEVERFEAGRWVHHWKCLYKDSCRDVDGHGVCAIGNNLYILPAANASSVEQGEQKHPLRPQTSCSPSNRSEILQFDGYSWTHHGVCLPPTECFDFDGKAGFALCAHFNEGSEERWLPWRALSNSGNNGQVTRCKDERTLEEFRNNTWVQSQTCGCAFKCRHMGASLNGGCVADNVTQIMALGGIDAGKPTDEGSPQGMSDCDSVLYNLQSTSREPGAPAELLPLVANRAASYNNANRLHPRGPEFRAEDNRAVHREVQSAVEQGNKLVFQGRALLKTIFGDRTDEYIKDIIQGHVDAGSSDDPNVTMDENSQLFIIDFGDTQKHDQHSDLDSD